MAVRRSQNENTIRKNMRLLLSSLLSIQLLCACGQKEPTPNPVMPTSVAPASKAQSMSEQKAGTEISGQVFIVTKGRENIKLALVEVSAIPEALIAEHIRVASAKDLENKENVLREFDLISKRQKSLLAKINSEFRSATEGERKRLLADQNRLKEILARMQRLGSGASYFDKLPNPITVSKTDADGKFALTLPQGRSVIAATASRELGKSNAENYYWLVVVDTASPKQSLMLTNDNLFETGCGECIQPNKYVDQTIK